MHPHSMLCAVARTIRTALCVVSILALAACGRGEVARTAPTAALAIKAPTATPTLDPDEVERDYFTDFREAYDLFRGASSAHTNLSIQLRRDANLFGDDGWRASVQNEIDLLHRANAVTISLEPPDKFVPANDAMITASSTYSTAVALVEQAIAQNDSQAFQNVEDVFDQADSQLSVATSFYFAED